MAAIWSRINTLLLLLILLALLALIGMVATGVRGGPLDPAAAPASTMRTLDEVDGAWSRRLDSTNGSTGGAGEPPAGCDSSRFRCVLPAGGNQTPVAVLDLETGLVWERNPADDVKDHWGAQFACESGVVGQRRGWRLPTSVELQSLFDGAGGLPAGHPFVVTDAYYWTQTTTYVLGDNWADVLNPVDGDRAALFKVNSALYWCVRGGNGYDTFRTNPPAP